MVCDGSLEKGSEEKEGSFIQKVTGETLCWVLRICIEEERCCLPPGTQSLVEETDIA